MEAFWAWVWAAAFVWMGVAMFGINHQLYARRGKRHDPVFLRIWRPWWQLVAAAVALLIVTVKLGLV